jgi:cytochrome c oxidase subunit 2
LIGIAGAQTQEQLHQSNPDYEKDRIHAKGVWPNPEGLKVYAGPDIISSDGAHFDWLFGYVTAGTFFYFILMILGVVWFTFAYREKRGAKAYYTDGHKEHKVTLFFDILFFVTLDVVLIYFSVVDTQKYFMAPPAGKDVVRVQVMPQQWMWNFRYTGNDGEFGTADDIVTVNEMWVPKGKTISLQIKSKDVIHGFMVPEIRRQMDALPGTVTRMWFELIKTGDFEIACMHLCGTAHYKMKGFMKVVEQNDFEAWSKEMSEWSEARYDPDDVATHWGWNWGI